MSNQPQQSSPVGPPRGGDPRFPFSGIPSGWYMVGESSELKPGQVLTRKYFGTDIVLYRTESGEFRATHAFCPHLGAHMGQGDVCGEELRCAFHGFTFDGAGKCTGTPYEAGRPPRRAILGTYPARDKNGILLVYFDALGREPTWETPDLDLSESTDFLWDSFELNSHPQETSENSVDMGHFSIVHDFMSPRTMGPVEIDGPLLKSKYGVSRRLDFIGLPQVGAPATFDVFVHGLGYSLVNARVQRPEIRIQMLIMSTPIHESRIHLRIGTSVQNFAVPGLSQLARRVALYFLRLEVAADVPIWEAKRYEARPALAEGDGEIALYRRWASQFYPPEPSDAGKVKLTVA